MLFAQDRVDFLAVHAVAARACLPLERGWEKCTIIAISPQFHETFISSFLPNAFTRHPTRDDSSLDTGSYVRFDW